MGTKSDFGIAALATANAEGLIATLSVPGGSHLKKLTIGNRLGVGTIYACRIDWAGCKTPQKFVLPTIYDSVGTEVQPQAIFSSDNEIELDIVLDPNVNTVYIYGTADTNATTAYAGLVWE